MPCSDVAIRIVHADSGSRQFVSRLIYSVDSQGCNVLCYGMEIPEKLKDFINESRQPLPPVSDIDELLRLDSLAMMRLVSFMEAEVDYTVQDDELTLQNFESLRSIGKMMQGEGAKMG